MFRVALVVVLFVFVGVATPAAAQSQVNFDNLAGLVRELRDSEAALTRERVARFQSELQRQERLAREAETRRNTASARSAALDREWESNEQRIMELNELLTQHQGNLGELFGVTRQVAGDAATTLQQSLLSTQYSVPEGTEERSDFLRRLAAARALPSIYELERLWFELQQEMTDGGKVVAYETNVLGLDPAEPPTERKVVRIGPFTAVSDGEYLAYIPSRRSLSVLEGRMPGAFRAIARDLQNASDGAGHVRAVVDPARGALLGLYVQRPGILQRIEEGEVVNYVIIAVGVIGALLALFQYGYLFVTWAAVRSQLRNIDEPKESNPLGRVLLVSRSAGGSGTAFDLSELRISEAILRELPKLERFQSFLRLAVAAGPLLGLIGTVVGMIVTFKAITATASSDPKLMASGIGQAMIATVLGLGIAIPLLFVNAGLTELSRRIIQVLDEQSQSLIAGHMRRAQTT
jgi:biopolymer transport protein ExbB